MGTIRSRRALAAAALCAAFAATGCGSDDEQAAREEKPAAAQGADLRAIKTYLLEHTAKLSADTATLREQAEGYYSLAESVDFDYDKLLSQHRAEVQKFVKDAQRTFVD